MNSSRNHQLANYMPDEPRARDFVSIAVRIGVLNQEQASSIFESAIAQHLQPCDYALKHGQIQLSDADIIETMLGQDKAIPGYEIIDLLGRGGMGVVFHARQLSLGREVALKTILLSQLSNPVSAQRFEHEARTLASVTHPNIVTAFDFGRHAGRLYLAMELVRGKDISSLLHSRGRLPESFVWQIIRQATAGLAHAAKSNVIHRDIKPANLLLVQPPEGLGLPEGVPLVKIVDFGLSILVDGDGGPAQDRLTSADVHVGSPAYMAPEMIASDEVGLQADIFSLGITAWHMLVGKPPLAHLPMRQIVTQRLTQPTVPVHEHVPTVTEDTNQLIVDMTRLDADQRIDSYDILLARIDQLLEEVAVQGSAADWASNVDSLVDDELATELQSSTREEFGLAITQQLSEPLVKKKIFRWSPMMIALVVTSVLVVGLISANLLGWFHTRPPTRATLELSGPRSALFDGQTLNGWQPRSGSWSADINDEGGNVLRGTNGRIKRSLDVAQQVPYFQVEMLIARESAESVALDFASGLSEKSSQNLSVRCTSTSVELVRKKPNGSPIQVLDSLPLSGPNELLAIRIQNHIEYWTVAVDGSPVFATHWSHQGAYAIQLEVKGGTASFSDISFAQLRKKPTESDSNPE